MYLSGAKQNKMAGRTMLAYYYFSRWTCWTEVLISIRPVPQTIAGKKNVSLNNVSNKIMMNLSEDHVIVKQMFFLMFLRRDRI